MDNQEQVIKFLCKFAIENGSRPLTQQQKEILKTLVDQAHSYEELMLIAATSLGMK